MDDLIEVPVLIVGGGPVGLSLAMDLGWRGIACQLLERGDGTISHPKMGAMNTRTMEYCRRWGIVDRVHKGGFPDDYGLNITFCTSVTGHLLAREVYPAMRDTRAPPTSPERWQRGSQLWFDPLLAAGAAEYPHVKLRYHCQFESLEEAPDGVAVRAVETGTGRQLQIRSQYLVGCDGAGSGIRRALNIPMEGDPVLSQSVGIFFRSRELYELHDKGQTQRFIFIGPEGTRGNLTAVDGIALWRLTLVGGKDSKANEGLDVDAALLQMAGRPFAYEVISVLPWRRSHLVAARYGSGKRIFLAGDAVHTMSPTGGHGMNTGLGDAVDLGWKLEAMINGWGGPHLLKSYEEERWPIGHRNVNAATKGFHRMVSAKDCARILDETPEGTATRQRVGAAIKEATLMEWETLGVQLGYRYEGSPIIWADGTPEPPDDIMDYVPTSRPGSRAPHAWLKDGRSTLDLFGRGFVLLRFADMDVTPFVEAAKLRDVPFSLVRIDDTAVAALYERRLVLVRPDGHVAWRGDALPPKPLAVIDRIRGAIAAKDHKEPERFTASCRV